MAAPAVGGLYSFVDSPRRCHGEPCNSPSRNRHRIYFGSDLNSHAAQDWRGKSRPILAEIANRFEISFAQTRCAGR